MLFELINLLKISRNELENLLNEKLIGDFMELSLDENEFLVRVRYENKIDLKTELKETLKYELDDIDDYLDELIEDETKYDVFVQFNFGEIKRLIEDETDCKLTSSNEFHVDMNCEYLLLYIN